MTHTYFDMKDLQLVKSCLVGSLITGPGGRSPVVGVRHDEDVGAHALEVG